MSWYFVNSQIYTCLEWIFSFIFAEGLQAVQLEDGTTAYIAHTPPDSIFADNTNLESTLNLEQLAAQVNSKLHALFWIHWFYNCFINSIPSFAFLEMIQTIFKIVIFGVIIIFMHPRIARTHLRIGSGNFKTLRFVGFTC